MLAREQELPALLKLTLDDEIRLLIGMHGRAAVKASIRNLTSAPRGRPEVTADRWLFTDLIKADAVDWLAGRDPFKIRSNTAIAQQFAKKEPGQSAESTVRRIYRKLSKEREHAVMVAAVVLSGCGPSELSLAGIKVTAVGRGMRLKALKALAEDGDAYWREMLEADQATLRQYTELHGDPPPDMCWRQILERSQPVRSVDANDLLARAGLDDV